MMSMNRPLPPLLIRAALRHFLRHPWMTGLAIFGIALGVAVVTAVDLANEGAMRAMRLTVSSLGGTTTHTLSGTTTGLDENLFAPLRWSAGVEHAAPIVAGTARWHRFPEKTLKILGIDPIAEIPIRPRLTQNIQGPHLHSLLTVPGTALLSTATATHMGVAVGDTIPLLLGDRKKNVTLIGLIDPADPHIRQGLADTVVMDIASAQELLDFQGRLTRIDLVATPGMSPPPVVRPLHWIQTRHHGNALEGMTEAFRRNLSVLGLLALLVGMFIIFNTITFSVVRRRHLIGLLRAQGVTRRELMLQLFIDGLLLGLPGTLLGLLLGIALGKGLLGLVVQTINDLYFSLEVVHWSPEPLSLLKGALLGLGATAVATWPAAWEAVSIPPSIALTRSALEQSMGTGVSRAGRWGAILLFAGGAILWLPGEHLDAGFAALGLIIPGSALMIPRFMTVLVAGLRPMARYFGEWKLNLALGSIPRNLSRTGVAMAALTVAVATAIGMGILVESFRATVERWLNETIASDIYVSSGETSSGAGVETGTLDPELIRALAGVPGVASVGLGRRLALETPEGMINLFVLDVDRERFLDRWFLAGDPETLWPRFANGDIVLVSESFAFRRKVRPGSNIDLPAPQGPHPIAIGGILADYRSDTASITISRSLFARLWDDAAMGSMGIRIAREANLDTVMDRLYQAATPWQPVEIQSNRRLREASLEIFDRTFAVTRVLRLISIAIAFFGIWTALMAIQLERTRELAVFRALGMTRGELLHINLLETALLGLVSGIIAMPLGWLLGLLLVEVINHRSFGWSLVLETRPGLILQAIAIALPAALMAGFFPSRHMAATSPMEALRELE
ncbi:MAG: ABC transporter permease [Magnetococcales bacterium]|nr:ABC transporter permease [Magnetococcales bacterium]